jgi:hypothetical protein
MAENRPAAVLPKINQAALPFPAVLGVEVKIPGPEYRGKGPQKAVTGGAGFPSFRRAAVYGHNLLIPYLGEGGALKGA